MNNDIPEMVAAYICMETLDVKLKGYIEKGANPECIGIWVRNYKAAVAAGASPDWVVEDFCEWLWGENDMPFIASIEM